MRAYLKKGSKYTGIAPSPISGKPGDLAFPVYADRDHGAGWEGVELTARDGGQFDARYTDSNRQLAITPDGRLESRAAGAVGPWETFFCTTQPDGSNLLYRFQDGVLVPCVLTIEAA